MSYELLFSPRSTAGSESHALPPTRHRPPEAMHSLKGKPETGIKDSVIYPQPTIRSPHGAPFEFCLSLFNQASEPPGL